jgi:hypothetical protein
MTDNNNVIVNAEDGIANMQPEMLREYLKQSYEILTELDNLKEQFKGHVETVAAETTLKKGVVSKYLKARYKQATKVEKELGQVFDQLDSIADEA